jgi:hypothetical protein
MTPVYRCGYCGHPATKNGTSLTLTEIEQTGATFKEWDEAEQVHGDCCAEIIQFQDELLELERRRNEE